MPTWKSILSEIQQEAAQSPLDKIRQKYLRQVETHTDRNIITYYSGWLDHPRSGDAAINDRDINALMACVHNMPRAKGLDIVLHTPGGSLAAAEAIVNYLRALFPAPKGGGFDIRAIIPQLAMSAGTLIALSCKAIIMGKHSSLGPIDPQLSGMPCQGVLDEIEYAMNEIKKDPSQAALWQPVFAKFNPTFINSCRNAIAWSESLSAQWLLDNMLINAPNKKKLAQQITRFFSSHETQKHHGRHISTETCRAQGLFIQDLEADQQLQDEVLSLHHAYMHTFGNSTAIKIIENAQGVSIIEKYPISK